MKQNNKRFILFAYFSLLLLLGLYLIAFKYQIGSHVKAEWWIKNTYDVKNHIASSIKKPKIIIAGGSNCLFGINGSIIEEITGYKVANLAVHASLHPNFLYYKIKKYLKKGDIVVLPLEFSYYRKDKIQYWFSNNMMAWGTDYLRNLSPMELFHFVLSVPENRIYEGVIQSRRDSLYLNRKDAIEKFNSSLVSGGPKYNGYSFKSLDRYGGINVRESPTKMLLDKHEKGIAYLDKNFPINDTFISFYFRLKDIVDTNDGKLILTWPVTIKNKFFDLRRPDHKKKLMDFKDRLSEKSIEICFNPALFNFDVSFFFDTLYHTNKYGADIRSKNLAGCINKMIQYSTCGDMGFEEALEIVRIEEAQYLASIDNNNKRYKKNHQIVLEDLKKIQVALSKYYNDNKKYPISIGFDGLYTKYGKAGKDWIPGLVPKYLDTLPRDPRKTIDGNKQYLYKSNGKDYKLISHAIEKCKDIVESNPMLIDPTRICWAYGYWTKGAKNW